MKKRGPTVTESNNSWLLDLFQKTEALQAGHFLLSSGLHSGFYFQCAKLLQYPRLAWRVGMELSRTIKQPVTHVIGPAMGGIIVAHEVGVALSQKSGIDVPIMFTERVNGEMALRRGFELPAGSKVLICEDVVTSGKSVREVLRLVQEAGADVVQVASIVNRANDDFLFGSVPWTWLTKMELPTYNKDECPACQENMEDLRKPGSRV